MIDLWPRLEPLLARVERPARYLDHEWGSTRKEGADFNYCMVYPDTYELGQPNQAVRILVNAVNATEHLAAERAFLPAVDLIDLMREEGVPMFSLESCAPLSEFDAIGITLPHELAASNVLEVLDLSGLPLRAVDRAQDDPIVLGGGPCVFNPEPYAPFFDAMLIGEGEESLPEALLCVRECRRAGATRQDILRSRAHGSSRSSRAFPSISRNACSLASRKAPDGSRASSLTPNACMIASRSRCCAGARAAAASARPA